MYNLDTAGNVVIQKLEKKDFFKEKAEDNIGIINFTFPNLKPGSVVEFRYRKIEKDIARIDSWIIQDEIPVRQAYCVVTTPNTSRIYEKVLGADTIEQKKDFITSGNARLVKRTYSRENIASFRYEPFMSSVKDNLLKVIFIFLLAWSLITEPDDPKSAMDCIWNHVPEIPVYRRANEKEPEKGTILL